MSTIPVVWKTYQKDTIARGYWDQGILEDLFAHKWATPGTRNFVHYEDDFNQIPKNSGAIVVIPARHNKNYVQQISKQLSLLPWCVLILTGDEESEFPLQQLAIKCPHKIWVMSPKPGLHPQDTRYQYLGSGYPPDIHEHTRKIGNPDKTINWFFSGQVTHERRQQCVEAAKQYLDNIHINETSGFTQGYEREDYYRLMSSAKGVLAPSGPVSVDSFRLYEALECGSIPVADGRTPTENQKEHWNMVFGSKPEFPVVDDWNELANLSKIVERHVPISNKIGSWWELQKRKLSLRLNNDLDYLGVERNYFGVENDMTVIIVTSPISAHPNTTLLQDAINSIKSRPELTNTEIFVLCDGVRIEQEHYRENYEKYVSNVLFECRNNWRNVYPIVFEEHTHQARMLKQFLETETINTDYIMFVEHDTFLTGDIPISMCIQFMRDNNVDMLRFHHENKIHEEHKHLFDNTPVEYDGERFIKTVQWSQRPHIANTQFYLEQLQQHFSANCKTMIEDVMHGVAQNPEWEHQIFMYYPEGGCQRSGTTDGRGNDPKFDMVM